MKSLRSLGQDNLAELYTWRMSAEPAERVNVSGVRELPVAEARSRLAELIDAVSDGEFIYLTRRGKRVAALLPSDIAEHYEQIEDDYWARRAAEAHDRLRAHPAATVPWEQVIAELESTGQ
jgi:prevent-host-death family protein